MKDIFSKFLIRLRILFLIALCSIVLFLHASPATASIDNDRYDGNIFVVYAGNGSLVPSKLTFTQALERETPIILVYYLDDSSDCKEFAIVVSRLQEFYGRAANIIPISVDTIKVKDNYSKNEVGYYYQGFIPETVVLDFDHSVVFDGVGQVKYEDIDDKLREVFDLLPRTESVELKRRSFNEFNTELVD